jgi:predicted phosphate transport protein (TIGR00153 family)
MFGSNKKKDDVFFAAFRSHAEKSVEGAKMLVEMFTRLVPKQPPTDGPYRGSAAAMGEGGPDEITIKLASAIKDAEHAGDAITHATVKRLHETWITPLDRFDIHGLISRMDDVLDLIEAVSERVVLFEVQSAPAEAVTLSEILVRGCEAMVKAMVLLPDMGKAPEILKICVEINRLENEADGVYRKAIAELFKHGNDPLLVMKWRDIFDSLESASDRCEDVANIVEGVVLEYA